MENIEETQDNKRKYIYLVDLNNSYVEFRPLRCLVVDRKMLVVDLVLMGIFQEMLQWDHLINVGFTIRADKVQSSYIDFNPLENM